MCLIHKTKLSIWKRIFNRVFAVGEKRFLYKPNIKTCAEPIICFKVYKTDVNFSYRAVFQNTHHAPGLQPNVDLGFYRSAQDEFKFEEGYHTFITMDGLRQYWRSRSASTRAIMQGDGYAIVKCIIPIGTDYVEGVLEIMDSNKTVPNYCSETIEILERISWTSN